MDNLVIDGAVDRPEQFCEAALADLPGQVPDVGAVVARREGAAVRLSALLDRVGAQEKATHVTVETHDGGFSASVPLDSVRHGLIVYRLGDGALPEAMGGPYRFLIPDAARCHTAEVDTCANVKFVGRITLTEGPGRDTRPESPASHAELHRREREGA